MVGFMGVISVMRQPNIFMHIVIYIDYTGVWIAVNFMTMKNRSEIP